MDENSNLTDETARLENALERIAVLAQRRHEDPAPADMQDVAAHLDSMIDRLRAALAGPS